MSYILDGIETAMTQRRYESSSGVVVQYKVECPCGWSPPIIDVDLNQDLYALRFHYMHCQQARLRKGEEDES